MKRFLSDLGFICFLAFAISVAPLSATPRWIWTSKIARKIQASKEVWGTIFGTINTREKFLDKRLELAQHEWTRLKTNNSLECRNCHNLNSMDFTRQSQRAMQMHSTDLASGAKTCIDCHKGIAHRLPDVRQAQAKQGG